jgi:ABC-type uncharacterized transport system ATPase subunit
MKIAAAMNSFAKEEIRMTNVLTLNPQLKQPVTKTYEGEMMNAPTRRYTD